MVTPPLLSDFRSDTVTRPTEAMRRAMAEAEVGDDVFGDDPSALRLEEEAARIFGKEAALFFPSGTMANLAAILAQCAPGEEALSETHAHTLRYEQGGAARFGGVTVRGVRGDAAGRFDPAALAGEVVPKEAAPPGVRLHCAPTTLILVENTHNFAGGRVQPLDLVRSIASMAHERGVRVHLDGARIMNACVAANVEPSVYAEPVDTVMCGLSKALAAPVGSLLAGPEETIFRARLVRKALGGGMRQVGVLAAPALLALREMPARLAEDHALARRLATDLATIDGIAIDPETVETNILFFGLRGGAPAHAAMAAALRERGVGVSAVGAIGVRMVTHLDVGEDDVDRALAAIADVMARGLVAQEAAT